MIANRYSGKCTNCNKKLQGGEGYAYKDGMVWKQCCTSTACMTALGQQIPNNKRELSADGRVTMPYDKEAITYLRALPGAKWNPEGKFWSCSIKSGDLPRVIEIAKFIKLDIAPELIAMANAGTPEMRKALRRADILRNDGKGLFPFQREGVKFLSIHNRALLADDMGLGKMQPVTEPVLTPDGWKPIGTIKVGNSVIGKSGNPIKVTGVYNQKTKDVWEVKFSDGSSTRCGEDHLWAVQTPNDRVRNPSRLRILPLKEIIKSGLFDKNNNSKWFIPVTDPVNFSEKEFIIHPYLLGALLANGSFGDSIVHSGCEQQREAMLKYIPEGLFFHCCDDVSYRITHGHSGKPNVLVSAIRSLGLSNLNSPEKFIPENYMFGSIAQRLFLLQGLVDNDGTVSEDGYVVEYNTTSPMLAKQVVELVRSLGGIALESTRVPKFEYKGKIKEGLEDHRIHIKLPSGLCPVSIPRKKNRFVEPTKYQVAKSFSSITRVNDEESVCIMVDAEDHLYITNDYIVTHNTVEAIASVEENAAVLVICPAAVKFNWRNEFAMWRPEFKVTICDTKNSFVLPVAGQVVIMTYAVLPKTLEEETVDVKITAQLNNITVIADEFHNCKNYKSARSKRTKGISTHAKTFWALTGTPLMNRAQDLYGILDSGNMKVFSSWTQFVKMFNGYKTQWGGYEFGMPCPEVPEMMKKVMLRRLKSEVLKDLPKKTYKNIVVNDIGVDLKSEMDKFLRNEAINQGIIDEKDTTTSLDDIVDLMDMPGFEEFAKIRAKLAASRVEAMMEIVESYEDAEIPLVVFSAHRAPIDALNAREGWASITGDTKAENRTNIVKDFQAGKLKGIALTIQAGGIGITLTRASNALFVDLDWTPSLNLQAEDRLNRIGQTADSLLIMRMTSNHVLDLHVNRLLEYKIKLAYEALEHSPEYNQTIHPTSVVTEESEEQMRARMEANTTMLVRAEKQSTKKYYLSRIDRIAEREANKVSHVPAPKLTPEIKEGLRKALDFMDSRCDGAVAKDFVGFNKPDSFIGKWIAKTGLDDSDEKTFRVLERILCRYRQQLSGFHIWE